MAGEAQYRRIAADVRHRIETNEWAHGENLPSRRQMAARYKVHEQTIRLAYQLLRREGILGGSEREAVYVAHPPAMRTLTDADADWPYGSETTGTHPRRATADLAERLGVAPGLTLQHETIECLDPGGRSAMLISSWWRGKRQTHSRFVVEVSVAPLAVPEAHALGLLVDTLAYRLIRTRLDTDGRVLETADLVLPLDRWQIRLATGRVNPM